MYDFDEVIDRSNTWSSKWDPDSLEEIFGSREVLPLWVADMDFRVAPPIQAALKKVADHGIIGYSKTQAANEALASWMKRRHQWEVQVEWVLNTPGIVFALNVAIQTFSRPGDGVLIQEPVYYPFARSIEANGRRVISSDLLEQGDGSFAIDFDDFEAKAQDPLTSLLILCSPHNPLGRVYSAEELKRLLDIALANDLTVVVDEIHGDLIMPGTTYTTVGNLGADYANQVITCLAPSKTFNLAGIQWSGIVIPDAKMRRDFQRSLDQLGFGIYNPFAFAAVTAAYNESEAWLDQVIDYIYGNYRYLKDRLHSDLPAVKVLELEATYLAFVDFRSLVADPQKLEKLMIHQAKVGLDGGDWFGPQGAGFMRINLACPRATLEEALDRIVKAFQGLD